MAVFTGHRLRDGPAIPGKSSGVIMMVFVLSVSCEVLPNPRKSAAYRRSVVRLVASASRYVSNNTLGGYLKIETAGQLATKHY